MGQSKWLVNSFPTLSKNLFIWRLNLKWVQKSTAARERVRWSCLHRRSSFSVIQTFQRSYAEKKSDFTDTNSWDLLLYWMLSHVCCYSFLGLLSLTVHWRLMMLMSPQMSRFCAANRGESRARVWDGGEADDLHTAARPAGGRRCVRKAPSFSCMEACECQY